MGARTNGWEANDTRHGGKDVSSGRLKYVPGLSRRRRPGPARQEEFSQRRRRAQRPWRLPHRTFFSLKNTCARGIGRVRRRGTRMAHAMGATPQGPVSVGKGSCKKGELAAHAVALKDAAASLTDTPASIPPRRVIITTRSARVRGRRTRVRARARQLPTRTGAGATEDASAASAARAGAKVVPRASKGTLSSQATLWRGPHAEHGCASRSSAAKTCPGALKESCA